MRNNMKNFKYLSLILLKLLNFNKNSLSTFQSVFIKEKDANTVV